MEDIDKYVIDFFSDYCSVNKVIAKKNTDVCVFDSLFNMQPEDLVYVVKYLEQQYKIKYEEVDFMNYKFSTLKNIIRITQMRINLKEQRL